jgi:hypothetical protein
MGTNCAPLLADLFLYSYESEFLQKFVKDKKMHETRAFNFTYMYIERCKSQALVSVKKYIIYKVYIFLQKQVPVMQAPYEVRKFPRTC